MSEEEHVGGRTKITIPD